jgi:hypothetical protein
MSKQSQYTKEYSEFLSEKTQENISSGNFRSQESATNAAKNETTRAMNDRYPNQEWKNNVDRSRHSSRG